MPKNIVQDILPPERKTIRNIPLPERRSGDNEKSVLEIKNYNHVDDNKPEQVLKGQAQRTRNNSRIILWGIAGLSLMAVFFAVSSIFVKADITVTPKQQKISLNANFNAISGNVPDKLSYQIITITENESKQIQATGMEHVERKASGVIVVYNNYSSASQKLIENTRFQTPDGLIYRIPDGIIIPGKSIKDGVAIPGSIEVTVFADLPGEKYNIGLVDFTIPGFKGDPRFKEIYGRSKTTVQGGFSGDVKKVSDKDRTKADLEIKADLREKTLRAAREQIPEGFVLYDNAAFFTFDTLPETYQKDNQVTFSEKGTLRAFLFSKVNLTRAIVKKTVQNSGSDKIELIDIAKLTFSISARENLNPVATSSIDFSLKGEMLAVWQYDETKLKNDLAGKSRKLLKDILSSGYPQIESASAVVTPLWKQSFPKNPNKINIKRILIGL